MIPARDALERLREGNRRFVSERERGGRSVLCGRCGVEGSRGVSWRLRVAILTVPFRRTV